MFGAVFRVRSRLAFAVHQFFQERGFVYVHTPIITASDCEGAGEMFRVTTLTLCAPAASEGEGPFGADFFGKAAYLTVSGQLEAEIFACALGNIYTFGPTFRAENSNTPRHAAEFWMIEPEMAFCDLPDDMDLAEELVKAVTRQRLEHCGEDMELFAKFVDKALMPSLEAIVSRALRARCPTRRPSTSSNAPAAASSSRSSSGRTCSPSTSASSAEEHFKSPVIVFDYPREIKPFYMRLNDDGRTVAAMDVLVPGVGEIIGGSQREERLDVLERRMLAAGLATEDYWWYLDLRRYGTVPHAGFGLGFERLLMFLTGVHEYPRRDPVPAHAEAPGVLKGCVGPWTR